MNYRHSYHAGSFTDVTKHIILTALIDAFKRKDTPFCYLDTHAGVGVYDLTSKVANKTKEYKNGIEKIINADNPPQLVREYLDCVHKINNQLTNTQFSSLQFYPGSPLIARTLARPHDRIVACELHPEDYALLKRTFAGVKQAAIHHADGYLGLKAFIPPKERRGFVLIDPPYEDPDEFRHIARLLPTALTRWETGVFAVWYPLKDRDQVTRFYRTVQQTVDASILCVELMLYPDLPNHLNGSGMLIINPPWQLKERVSEVLPWLYNALKINDQGEYKAYLLK